MSLPADDVILLSLVNTRLRDGDDLYDFCSEYGETAEALIARLSAGGYYFDEGANAFKRK